MRIGLWTLNKEDFEAFREACWGHEEESTPPFIRFLFIVYNIVCKMPKCFKTPFETAHVCKTEKNGVPGRGIGDSYRESQRRSDCVFCFLVWYEKNAGCFLWSMNCWYRKIGGYHARSWVQRKCKNEWKDRKVGKWCLSLDTARIARKKRKDETESSGAWRFFKIGCSPENLVWCIG